MNIKDAKVHILCYDDDVFSTDETGMNACVKNLIFGDQEMV